MLHLSCYYLFLVHLLPGLLYFEYGLASPTSGGDVFTIATTSPSQRGIVIRDRGANGLTASSDHKDIGKLANESDLVSPGDAVVRQCEGDGITFGDLKNVDEPKKGEITEEETRSQNVVHQRQAPKAEYEDVTDRITQTLSQIRDVEKSLRDAERISSFRQESLSRTFDVNPDILKEAGVFSDFISNFLNISVYLGFKKLFGTEERSSKELFGIEEKSLNGDFEKMVENMRKSMLSHGIELPEKLNPPPIFLATKDVELWELYAERLKKKQDSFHKNTFFVLTNDNKGNDAQTLKLLMDSEMALIELMKNWKLVLPDFEEQIQEARVKLWPILDFQSNFQPHQNMKEKISRINLHEGLPQKDSIIDAFNVIQSYIDLGVFIYLDERLDKSLTKWGDQIVGLEEGFLRFNQKLNIDLDSYLLNELNRQIRLTKTSKFLVDVPRLLQRSQNKIEKMISLSLLMGSSQENSRKSEVIKNFMEFLSEFKNLQKSLEIIDFNSQIMKAARRIKIENKGKISKWNCLNCFS